jgi:hypothetical protein
MSWDAIGALAEAVGALAVLLTLAYLAIQVKHAREATADTNRLSRAEGVRDMTLTMLQNDEVRHGALATLGAAPFYAESAERFGVTVLDAERIDYVAQFYFWLHWGQFSATMTESDRDELVHIVQAFYTLPPIRHSWSHGPFGKAMFEPRFVEFVDSVLADAPAA